MADSNICFLWFSAALHPTLWFCKQRKLCWCCWWHTALSSPSCILKCMASGSHLLFCPATSVEFRYEKRFRKAFPRWLLLYVSMVHYCDISSEGLAEVWHLVCLFGRETLPCRTAVSGALGIGHIVRGLAGPMSPVRFHGRSALRAGEAYHTGDLFWEVMVWHADESN